MQQTERGGFFSEHIVALMCKRYADVIVHFTHFKQHKIISISTQLKETRL